MSILEILTLIQHYILMEVEIEKYLKIVTLN
jgi:hypothetical protein